MAAAFQTTRDIIVRAPDLAAARAFYADVMALPVTFESDTLLCFQTGAINLHVEKGEVSGPVAEFLVPDVHAARQKLVAGGCQVIEENPSIPRLYLRDPFGFVFNLGLKR